MSTSISSPRISWSRWPVLIAIFLGSLLLYTRHNTFPYTYHPDEDTKVRQIVTGKRNFFHPLLMLSATDAAMKVGRIEKTPEKAAITGRWVAAIFTALAVMALALLAWRWMGWAGGVVAALLAGLNPLVFELAHYFKEDPALLMGLAVSFLALDVFWKSPGPRTAAFLGLGCALAISGKYLGVVVLLFALPALLKREWRLAGWFALGLLGPLLLINLPLLLDLPDFQKGISREMEGATGGHRGLGRDIPHAYYFGRLAELTPWGIWLGLVLTAGVVVWKRKDWSLVQWLTFAFPIFFLALLSFSPKTAGRYLLPVEAFAALLAGIGVMMGRKLPGSASPATTLAVAMVLIWSSAAACREYQREFSLDARADLRLWISENLPETATIAQDGRVDLAADERWKAPKLLTSEYVADLGTLAGLRAQGVTHVAVARQAYNRYFNAKLKPNAREKAEFERRATFYRELFGTGEPVWESQLGQVIYLHPGLRLYRIETPRPAATGR